MPSFLLLNQRVAWRHFLRSFSFRLCPWRLFLCLRLRAVAAISPRGVDRTVTCRGGAAPTYGAYAMCPEAVPCHMERTCSATFFFFPLRNGGHSASFSPSHIFLQLRTQRISPPILSLLRRYEWGKVGRGRGVSLNFNARSPLSSSSPPPLLLAHFLVEGISN